MNHIHYGGPAAAVSNYDGIPHPFLSQLFF